MHIILAVLGTVVTILVLLNKLQQNGLDVGWLNPFSWARRRKYRVNHDLNPAFKLESPLETVSLLMVAVAKVDGDMSKEQKFTILSLYDSEFHLDEQQARELMGSSVHLFGNGEDVLAKPQEVLKRSIEHFTPGQFQSMLKLMDRVASSEGEPTSAQQQLIKKVRACLPQQANNKW